MSDDEIKTTYVNSTKSERALWVHLMNKEKRRTGDKSLNLSNWIIRQLPKRVELPEFTATKVVIDDADLPPDLSDFAGDGVRHHVYASSVVISEQANGSYVVHLDDDTRTSNDLAELEQALFYWYMGI